MKTDYDKYILKTATVLFNILYGIFIGQGILLILFYVYDLLTPGYFLRGYYFVMWKLGLDITLPFISSLGQFNLFTSFSHEYTVSTLAFSYAFTYCAACLYSLKQVRSILKLACEDVPFKLVASRSIKNIGLAIIITPTILLLMGLMLFNNTISKSTMLYTYWTVNHLLSILLRVFFQWLYYAIIGAFFLVMGVAYKRGFKLQQENDLTV
jgi:hypothetical protein